MEIPEYIEGIPTEKKRVKERFELIKSYYENLWKDLQRETGSNYIHNKFLNADVYIVKNLTKFHSTSLSFGPSMVRLVFHRTLHYLSSKQLGCVRFLPAKIQQKLKPHHKNEKYSIF